MSGVVRLVETIEPISNGYVANPDIVAVLRKALNDAECGMVTAAAIATVRRTGHTRHDYNAGNMHQGHHLIASISYLLHDVMVAAAAGAASVTHDEGDPA